MKTPPSNAATASVPMRTGPMPVVTRPCDDCHEPLGRAAPTVTETMSQLALAPPAAPRKVLLIGNPNVGKSLLFTRLTNRYVTVSNYPGTTVEITTAKAELDGELCEIIDTPGTNGLAPQSNDERVARDILLASPDADVIQVGDISNLRRTLLLSLQLAEHDVPFTLCLNMSDEARARAVDAAALEEALGVPVIATSALKRWNIEKLKSAARQPRFAKVSVDYGEAIESAIREIGGTRGVALSMLSANVTPSVSERPGRTRGAATSATAPRARPSRPLAHARGDTNASDAPLAYAIAAARMAAVDRLVTLAT